MKTKVLYVVIVTLILVIGFLVFAKDRYIYIKVGENQKTTDISRGAY